MGQDARAADGYGYLGCPLPPSQLGSVSCRVRAGILPPFSVPAASPGARRSRELPGQPRRALGQILQGGGGLAGKAHVPAGLRSRGLHGALGSAGMLRAAALDSSAKLESASIWVHVLRCFHQGSSSTSWQQPPRVSAASRSSLLPQPTGTFVFCVCVFVFIFLN